MRVLWQPLFTSAPAAILLAALALTILVWPAWHGWFSVDDSAVLLCAQFPLSDLLFDRPTGNFCNPLFFTPGWPILFKPDSGLWGLAPEGYRLGNLTIAAVASGMLYWLVRPHTSRGGALLAALLLAIALPMVFGVGWITRRHYVAGFLLALFALWAFLRSDAGRGKPWLLLSVTAYFMAVLSKEAYAVIPALVFLLAWREPWRRRVLVTLPFAVALAVYLAWRWLMLGGMGGYPGAAQPPGELLRHGWAQFEAVPQALYGQATWALLVPAIVLWFRRTRIAILLSLTLLISLAPFLLYPGTGFGHAGKLFGAVAVVAVAFAFAWHEARGRKTMQILVLLAAGVVALGAVGRSMDATVRVAVMGAEFQSRHDAAFAPGPEAVLVIGELPYYFTAMNSLHHQLQTGHGRDLVALSHELALPEFADREFDRIVLPAGDWLDGNKARQYMERRLAALAEARTLEPPAIKAQAGTRSIRFDIKPEAGERIMRCLIRADYANCAEVGPTYVLPFPARQPILRLSFYRISQSDTQIRTSPPTKIDPARLQQAFIHQ